MLRIVLILSTGKLKTLKHVNCLTWIPKKFKRPKLEVEYIAAEDTDGKTFLVKWKDYVIDGAFGKEDPGITCQAKYLIPPDLISEFLDRNGDVSNSNLEHLSYRSTSTSFGPFSWEHASRLKDSCHDLVEDFWKLHGNRINRDIDYWPDDGTFRCHCCARPFKSAAACKRHLKNCANPVRNRTGSKTDEFIMNEKRKSNTF